MTRKCEPVGIVEIADRLNVKRGTVNAWRTRALGFPEPRWTVGGRPAWNWDEIEAWHAHRHHMLSATLAHIKENP